MKVGFDNSLYLKIQTEKILERIKLFDEKLYLEFGGKMFDDLHAARVLPGFEPNAKIKLLLGLKDKTEIVFCVNATHLEHNKIRADFGLTYDQEVLRLIDNLRSLGLYVSSVVITLYKEQPLAKNFAKKLERRGEKVYFHHYTKGYPTDINTIVSDEGYGANEYIKTSKPLVVITAPGPSSGKLATCLSQLYHEYKRGVNAGYAKFETFPVWNLPLKHPVNIAYESATADIKDVNMIDPFYFNEYGKLAVNYNRDIEVFPILKNILKKITGKEIYKSPTDMGVNAIGYAITNEEIIKEACNQEIIRRYYRAKCDYLKGLVEMNTIERIEMLLSESELNIEDRKVAVVANNLASATCLPVVALELPDGKIITGKTKTLISASAAALLNSLKTLAGIDDKTELISKNILEPILDLRTKVLGSLGNVLNIEDVLFALNICATNDKNAKLALQQLDKLKGCNAHASYILVNKEEEIFKKLGILITCEPQFLNNDLFIL